MKSLLHKSSIVKVENFQNIMSMNQPSVMERLNSIVASQINVNRQKLASIIKTIIFCGHQNIALRGHRESSTDSNPGNFKSLLAFRAESGDEILADHLKNAPRNAVYTSNTIQKEIIVLIREWIQSKIVNDIKEGTGVFAIVADEGRDCANNEQMPIIARYVDKYSTICEAFLTFVECVHGTTGSQLADLIEDTCTSVGLDLTKLRGQGYDGAANMGGVCSGAAKLLQTRYPKALYFHCASHKLNLCVAQSCKLSSVANVMNQVNSLAKFFNLSPKRQKCLEDYVGQYCNSSKSKLLPLCQTRWVERINALEVALDLLEAVVNVFINICENSNEWSRETVNLASSLLKSIDFEFVVNLVILQKALSFTSGLTIGLQKRGIDLADSCEQVELLIRTLKRIRDKVNEFHHDCFTDACRISDKLAIEIKMPRICKRQTHRSNTVPLSSVSNHTYQQEEDYFRINVTIPFIDELIQQLLERFSKTHLSVLKGVMLLPSSVITESNWTAIIQPFLQLYNEDLPSSYLIAAELELWQTKWNDRWSTHWKTLEEQYLKSGRRISFSEAELKVLKVNAVPNTIAAALVETNQEMFPNIYYLLCVLGVLPMTTCEAERCISTLRRLKTYMRSTISAEILTGCALTHTHRDIDIDIEAIISNFSIRHARRMRLSNILEDQ